MNTYINQVAWYPPLRENKKLEYIKSNYDMLENNGHCITMETGDLDLEAVKTGASIYVRTAINKLIELGCKSGDSRYLVSMPRNKNGKTFCHAYLWVSDRRVFNILNNTRIDGSLLYTLIPDPDYVPQDKPDKPKEQPEPDLPVDSWAYLDDSSSEEEVPMIKKWEAPYIGRLMVKYNHDQRAERLIELARNKGYQPKDLPQKIIDQLPEGTFIDLMPATAHCPEEGLQSNCLYSVGAPKWVTRELVLRKVSMLSTSKNRKYPLVKIVRNKGRMPGYKIYVTFDPSNNDGPYALLMLMRCIFRNPNNDDQTVELVFTYPRDRNY